jgi:5'-deoxynucleotidase YfbR-like HD superfamily hydrolase
MKTLREDERPADLWYWSDWFSSIDVRSCSLAARGLWADMLGIMSRSDRKGFLSINGQPMGSKELAKFVGEFKDKVEELLEELEYYRVFSRDTDGTIYNRRMAREADLSRKRAEAGRKGGSSKQTPSKVEANGGSKPQATLEDEDEDKSSLKNKENVSVAFSSWWSLYPRKIAKQDAAKAYAAAIRAGATPEDLHRALEGYLGDIKRNNTEERYVKHPATLLRLERWRDYLDITAPRDVGEVDPKRERSAAEVEYQKARSEKIAELQKVGGDPAYAKEQLARWSAEWWEKRRAT